MSTWTCRVAALALSALLLAGCDEATGLPFAAELGAIGEAPERERLSHVPLAGGEIVLSAPDGYCFDRRSVRRGARSGFAVMARCDTLGVRGFFGTRPLAIVTVATTPHDPADPLPTPQQVAVSAGDGRLLDSARSQGMSLAQLATGPQTLDGVSQTHWRGAFIVGRHLVGVSLYAPDGSQALTREGARILSNLSARTRTASAAASRKAQSAAPAED